MSRLVKSLLLACGATLLLAACERAPFERPPILSEQTGYRGTGQVEFNNPRILRDQAALHVAPPSTPPVPQEGPRAREVYQNVQVLGDLSVTEFTRTMIAITAWVSPEQGCNYCHNPGNLADDSKYTKIVARRMVQMNQHLNADWKVHVQNTGVTCYTCHRGNPVPLNTWVKAKPNAKIAMITGDDAGQNKAEPLVGWSSLPYDPFSWYLADNKNIAPIRVAGTTALPTGNRASIKQAEFTYALMVHMSESLGVNCTYCHNTQSFTGWNDKRVRAWHGIRMVGDANANYITPLTANFPADRLGPTGDPKKVFCATCHQGANKPLNGALMAKDYPALLTVSQVAAAPGAAAASVLGKVMFETGKSTLSAEAQGVIKAAAAMLATTPGAKVALSGFTDGSGNPQANADLAKRRAFAVRDALKAAGIAEDRVELRKPELVIGGATADSRRVDILGL